MQEHEIAAARLDLADLPAGFSSMQVLANVPQSAARAVLSAPSAVALPGGDVVVTYTAGPSPATARVVMRRAAPAGLDRAPAVPVFDFAGDWPCAVAIDDLVVFLCYAAQPTGAWVYRRYRHRDGTFLDSDPRTLASAAAPTSRPHLAASPGGGSVWVAFADDRTVRVLSFQPADGGIDAQASFSPSDPSQWAGNPFVLPRGPGDATLFWEDPGNPTTGVIPSIYWADYRASAWGTRAPVPGRGWLDPGAVLDGDGRTSLFATGDGAGSTDVFLRIRHPLTGAWSESRPVISGRTDDRQAYPVFAAGQGIWLQWLSIRAGSFHLLAKRIITAL